MPDDASRDMYRHPYFDGRLNPPVACSIRLPAAECPERDNPPQVMTRTAEQRVDHAHTLDSDRRCTLWSFQSAWISDAERGRTLPGPFVHNP